jgi:hypothetical protein
VSDEREYLEPEFEYNLNKYHNNSYQNNSNQLNNQVDTLKVERNSQALKNKSITLFDEHTEAIFKDVTSKTN